MEVCADRRTVQLAVAMQTEEEDTVHWSVYPQTALTLAHLRRRQKKIKKKPVKAVPDYGRWSIDSSEETTRGDDALIYASLRLKRRQ